MGVLQWHSDGVGVRSTNTIFMVRAGISYNSVFRRHAIVVVHMNVPKTRIDVSIHDDIEISIIKM